jgi:hypothetical protein
MSAAILDQTKIIGDVHPYTVPALIAAASERTSLRFQEPLHPRPPQPARPARSARR